MEAHGQLLTEACAFISNRFKVAGQKSLGMSSHKLEAPRYLQGVWDGTTDVEKAAKTVVRRAS
jgi:hypothetical protein